MHILGSANRSQNNIIPQSSREDHQIIEDSSSQSNIQIFRPFPHSIIAAPIDVLSIILRCRQFGNRKELNCSQFCAEIGNSQIDKVKNNKISLKSNNFRYAMPFNCQRQRSFYLCRSVPIPLSCSSSSSSCMHVQCVTLINAALHAFDW